MGDTVQTTASMTGWDDALTEVAASVGKREVSDGTARAIAAAWQSPGTVGHVLASLASGMPVDVTELLDDIYRTRTTDNVTGLDAIALDMLATWALNNPGRGE